MQQSLRRLDGVDSVQVNLLERWVRIYPGSDYKLNARRVWKRVDDSGLTMDEMSITARGVLSEDEDGLVFTVSGTDQSHAVADGEVARKAPRGNPVEITGLLFKRTEKEKITRETKLHLELLEVHLLENERDPGQRGSENQGQG